MEVNRIYKSALFPLTRQQIYYKVQRSVRDDTSSSIGNKIADSWAINKNKNIVVYRPHPRKTFIRMINHQFTLTSMSIDMPSVNYIVYLASFDKKWYIFVLYTRTQSTTVRFSQCQKDL